MLDQDFYGFVTMRATRGERGLGIEDSIFEDDFCAIRTIAR